MLVFALVAAGGLLGELAGDTDCLAASRLVAAVPVLITVGRWLAPSRLCRTDAWDAPTEVGTVGVAGRVLPGPSAVLGLLFAIVTRRSLSTKLSSAPVITLLVGYLATVIVTRLTAASVEGAVAAITPLPGVVITSLSLRLLVNSLTDRAVAEDRAARAGAKLQALIETSPAAVVFVDAGGNVALWNSAAERLIGVPSAQVQGQPVPAGLFPRHDRAGRDGDWAAAVDALRQHGPAVGREIVRHRDGGVAHLTVSAAAVPDPAGGPDGAVAVLSDITERKRLERQLGQRLLHDPLTGLGNRAMLLDRLETALAPSRDGGIVPLALLHLDLDDSRDSHDQVILAVARRINEVARGADLIARSGRTEFHVLLREQDEQAARRLARNLVDAVGLPVQCDGGTYPARASVGVVLSRAGVRPTELLRDAEVALVTAKRPPLPPPTAAGPERVQLFRPELYSTVLDRLALETDLYRALQADEFVVHYQPIVDLDSGRVAIVDAHLRWPHPQRGPLRARQFMPLAEDTGLAVPLGRRLVTEASAQIRQWQTGTGTPLTLGLAVSGRQLRDPDFVSDVTKGLALAGLPAERLVVNLTGALVADPASAASVGALRDRGVRVALDHFGSDAAGLAALRRLNVDLIKIDPKLTRLPERDERPMFAALLALTRALRLPAVAKGLHTDAQLAAVREFGCEYGQGDAVLPPRPAADLATLLHDQPAPAVDPVH